MAVLALFTGAAFLSAALLFLVEPLVARLLLPVLGGSPSVWTGCMLFYQAVLLAGYALAHSLSRRSRAVQTAALLIVLALGAAALPVTLASSSPPPAETALAWLLARLAVMVGGPFLALSAVAPLLQRWFAETAHRSAGDPYFLYASSNLGSLSGLLAYPLVVEPWLPLGGRGGGWGFHQSGVWSAGYLVLVAAVAACAVVVLRSPARGAAPGYDPNAAPWPRTSAGSPWRWVAYAFVPSSVMLGATQYLANDLVSAPFVWVLPLAMYLLSFVVTFSRRSRVSPARSGVALAVLAVSVAASLWAFIRPTVWMLPLHPLAVFAAGLVGHGRLAAERPEPARLTGFYLWIALGGVLGGAFNALLAPVLFDSTVEYPLALVLACTLRPAGGPVGVRRAGIDLALAAGVAAAAWGTWAALNAAGAETPWVVSVLAVGVPCAATLALVRRPLAFALALAALFATARVQVERPFETLEQTRSFFGVHRVVERPSDPFSTTLADGSERVFVVPQRILYHGTTRHGLQQVDPVLAGIPASYYHPTGPLGRVFAAFGDDARLDRVAVVGLGVGTVAAYGRPGQRMDFFELDPEVVRLARDAGWFTYLRDSEAETAFTVGDGRLSLASVADGVYGLIVIDAFSSDAIPVHLLTREAVETYLRNLGPRGLLALHLTNQYLDLGPVVEAHAHDLNLAGLLCTDTVDTPEQKLEGKYRSTWAVLARSAADLAAVDPGHACVRLPLDSPSLRRAPFRWTDDHANPLPILR